MDSVFRPYSESEAARSDRSAGDRLRHRQKVRRAIRENISDIVAEESIIGKSRDKIIKIPIRGVKEYRFVYGRNAPGTGTGDGGTEPGQVVGEDGQEGQQPGEGQAGDQAGIDYYETDVTLDELIEIMFEDLELPEMQRKRLREIESERASRRKGFRKVGIRAHLDKKRTAKQRIRRKLAGGGAGGQRPETTREAGQPERDQQRFPFHWEDMKYRRLVPKTERQSNAVVICIMDTSASMDTTKKYLARSFFFLLYQFVRTRYANVRVVFISHDARAREVTEEEFFSKGESGGTLISTGYRKALEVVAERFHPTMWNVYAFHCSDGDNWVTDNPEAIKTARELCSVANLFGYGEIKPRRSGFPSSSMFEAFEEVQEPNFHKLMIHTKNDIWPSFKALLSREQEPQSA